jgi:hypothetical protein
MAWTFLVPSHLVSISKFFASRRSSNFDIVSNQFTEQAVKAQRVLAKYAGSELAGWSSNNTVSWIETCFSYMVKKLDT